MNPSASINYYQCAFESYEAGNFAAAADYFRMILRANPNDFNAQFSLAMALSQDMQTGAALVQFQSISEFCPDPDMRRRAAFAATTLRPFQKK